MHPIQSIGYAAAYPAYPLNPPLAKLTFDDRSSIQQLDQTATRKFSAVVRLF